MPPRTLARLFGDIRVGTIAIRTGIPPHGDPWGWACGFYPSRHRRESTDGTAETFDQAHADFEDARRVLLAERSDADFETWRAQRKGAALSKAIWLVFGGLSRAAKFP
jgi:hypothetical protein